MGFWQYAVSPRRQVSQVPSSPPKNPTPTRWPIRSDHHCRIAAITGHASNNGVLAICRVAAATGLAGSVFTSKEPDSYTLADLPGRNTPANLLDAANCFMARHTRIHYAGQLSLNGARV